MKSSFEDSPNRNISTASNQKVSTRNLLMYSLGTFGRDFLYVLFSTQLLNYILFTKQISKAEFGYITLIIILARIFDALNDPIMGVIVDNTRSRWGKFKPWQFVGALLTGIVVIVLFTTNLQGSAFVGLLGGMYFMFSITFTMNDISYWGMMPSLTSDEHERSKLMSAAQLVASAGGGLAGFLIPVLTIGAFAIKGSAIAGYKVIAYMAAILMVGFQLFTLLGVKEKSISVQVENKLSLKQMFPKLIKNDQLMWSCLVIILYMVGTGVVFNGLSTAYVYFEFGYSGLLATLFFAFLAVATTLFTVTYPWLEKKFTRTKMVYYTGFSIIFGYLLLLIIGLVFPSSPPQTVLWYVKYGIMALTFAIVGFGQGFYMIMVIAMANTVEYSEHKTGIREEGLFFSLRPFAAKFSSAITQGIVTMVYLIAGVLTYTNGISALENEAAQGVITEDIKLNKINEIIESVSNSSKIVLLVSMCLIPMIFMTVALIIYKKKYILDEKTFNNILKELEERKGDKLEEIKADN